jgi:23S rRNA (adenine2503-C2)-methyltransferase
MLERPALYDLTYEQLSALLAGWGEPRFRADQVWGWLYSSLVGEVQAMGNLPADLRARLTAETRLSLLEPVAEEESPSGQTRKVLFRLVDELTVESVLMQYYDRCTACISTQVGCGMSCVFCATGYGGLARNLSAGEIVAQVVYFAREIREELIGQAQAIVQQAQLPEHPVSNVVLMGMGEPLANYDATWQAIETLTDPRGYGLGARRITISTVGLVPGIRRLAGERLPVNLAVSLHASDDELRTQLVPVNARYPLADLMAAVHDYVDLTQRRVTFEYALIDGINDTLVQARRLVELLRGLLCHVNLIPLNPVTVEKSIAPDSHPLVGARQLRPSPREQVDAFRAELEAGGIPTTVRMRRGIEIEAGCGQLRQRAGGR